MSDFAELGPFPFFDEEAHRHRELRRAATPIKTIGMARRAIRAANTDLTYSALVTGALTGSLAVDPARRPQDHACCDRTREVRAFYASTLVLVLTHQRLAATRAR